MGNNIWRTDTALTKHYIKLTNYRRVVARELAKEDAEYYLIKQLLLTELLIGVIRKMLGVKLNISVACLELGISRQEFYKYLNNGKQPNDIDLIKMAQFINK